MMAVLDPGSALAVRLAAVLIFASAAYGKRRAPAAFRETLAAYRLLPAWAVPAVANGLPLLEAAVAAMLIDNKLCPYPEIAAALLFALFAGAMAVNLLRGRARIACGCSFGGAGADRLHWFFVLRNIAAAGLLLTAAGETGISFPQAVTGVLGGLALFLVVEAANALAASPGADRRTRPS